MEFVVWPKVYKKKKITPHHHLKSCNYIPGAVHTTSIAVPYKERRCRNAGTGLENEFKLWSGNLSEELTCMNPKTRLNTPLKINT